jgi:hypothetical protein
MYIVDFANQFLWVGIVFSQHLAEHKKRSNLRRLGWKAHLLLAFHLRS